MLNIKKFWNGLKIVKKAVLESDDVGELEVDQTSGKLNYHDNSSRSPVVTEAHSATLTNKSIDADQNTITNIDNADIKAGAGIEESKLALDFSTSDLDIAITDHTSASADVHGIGSTASVVGTDTVQTLTDKTINADFNTISNLEVDNLKAGVLDTDLSSVSALDDTIPSAKATKSYVDTEVSAVETDLSNHISTGGHPATAISNTPAGSISSTDVQAAINELDGDIQGHITDTTDAHAATAITNTPAGSISATTVQAAINELDGDVTAVSGTVTSHISASTDVHGIGATASVVGTTTTQTLTNKTITGADIRTPVRSDVKQDTKANLTTYATTATNGQLVFATDDKQMFQVVDGLLQPVGGGGSSTLNLIEDPSFESSATEGSITGGTASLNTVTVLPTPNNKSSLELNFNNVTGSYILEKNTGSEYDGVQGLVSVWIKNAKAGVKLIPRINGADSTALSVDVKTDNKWNEYVIPAVIGTTSFGFKVDVTASNAGSLFIDEATVGAMPATMTPEVVQAEYFGGLRSSGAANCVWATTSNSYANFGADADCNSPTVTGAVSAPSTKIPAVVIPAGSPSGTYQISFQTQAERSNDNGICFFRMSDGTLSSSDSYYIYHNTANFAGAKLNIEWAYSYTTSSVDTVINVQAKNNNGTTACNVVNNGSSIQTFDVYYYPPKSKIYSNKSMGWYVDVNIGGANPSLGTGNVSTYTSISNAGLDMVINPGSQPAQIPCSGTNPSTGITCSAGDEQIGVVFDILSVGTYEVCSTFTHQFAPNINTDVAVVFQSVETPNNAQTITQEGKAKTTVRHSVGSDGGILAAPHTNCSVFNFTSVGKKTVRLMFEQQIVSGSLVGSTLFADRASVAGQRDIHITVKPFINNEQITASFKQIDDALQAIPNQNLVINGNFDFWQRGTSLSAAPGQRYLADRFETSAGGTTIAASRQTFAIGQADVPNNPKYFHRSVVASSVGAANFANFRTKIEDVSSLSGKTVTLSFWAKADSNKQMSIELFQNFGTGGSPSASTLGLGVQKINLTSSWQKFTRTVSLPSVIGKTLGTNNNDSTWVLFWFDAGTDLNSRTDSLGHQSGTFDIAQVKLEEGSVATPFVLAGGTIAGELAACQRYFEQQSGADIYQYTHYGNDTTGGFANERSVTIWFNTQKRANPNVVVTGTGNTAASAINPKNFRALSTNVSSTSYAGVSFWSADAEL